MSASHVPPMVPATARSDGGPSGLGRWAVVLAVIVVTVVTVAYTIFGVAFAVGGDDAISDTWVGYLAGISLLGGLAASLASFLMALVARLRGARQRLLWLPLTVFPALATIVLLAELFWVE